MVEIVTVGPGDWELVRNVRLRALAESPDSFGATLAAVRAQPEAVWRERLAGSSPTLVALHEGYGVAMGGGFLPPETERAWIWGMWTDPAVRGRGVGRRLLEALVPWALGSSRTPYLHVTEGNEAARELYLSCGFVPTGVWEPLREGSTLRIEELALRRG